MLTPLEIADKIMAERRMSDFAKQAWHVIDPVPLIWNWHLDAFCAIAEAVTAGKLQRVIVNVGPRRSKSSFFSVLWNAWEWTKNPGQTYMGLSFADDLSKRLATDTRRLIQSRWYQERWPHVKIDDAQNEKERFRTTAGGHRISGSPDGIATGDGANRIIFDDLLKISEGEQPARLEKVNHWFDTTVVTRINDPINGSFLGVCQRVAENDITAHLMEQGGWENLCLMEEYEPDHRSMIVMPGFTWDRDPRTTAGELLCPNRFGPKEVAQLKRGMTDGDFAKLYQQQPSPTGGGSFKREWYRYFETTHDSVDNVDFHMLVQNALSKEVKMVRASECQRVAVCDPASTDPAVNKRPCYTAILFAFITPDRDILIFDIYRKQANVTITTADAERYYREHKLDWIGVETAGIGTAMFQLMRKDGFTVMEIDVKNVPKPSRSNAAELRMRNGQIYFLKNAHWLRAFTHELEMFPFGQYVDQADCLNHLAIHVGKLLERKTQQRQVVASNAPFSWRVQNAKVIV